MSPRLFLECGDLSLNYFQAEGLSYKSLGQRPR